jgi:hypothetical protein
MGPLIRELRAETQFGLIRLLKPGCRSIILLVDKESKEQLLQQFARQIYCLRKSVFCQFYSINFYNGKFSNKTFSFGFLLVPKNLPWFRSLLELTLPGDDQEEDSGKRVHNHHGHEFNKWKSAGREGTGGEDDACGEVY